jgi:penicillin-binding protein 2
MANSMCLIANRGSYFIPHFVRAINGNSNHPALKKYLTPKVVAHIADSSFEYVIGGMQAVVDEGTGKIAHMDDVIVCAKTGTAQNERMINGVRVKLQNHSMFVAFAPRQNPRIAVAVCIENAGYGASWAGPIASLMIEQYLKDSITEKRKPLLKKMEDAKIIPNYTYILDSLDKKTARAKEAMKHISADSLKRANKIKDSLKRREDLAIGAYLFRKFYLKK